MDVCGNEQDKYVSTYGPSFRYIKDEEHTKENEFHFLFVEITFLCTINAIRWFDFFHRCTYQIAQNIKSVTPSFWKCEKMRANEIEREIGVFFCQPFFFCSYSFLVWHVECQVYFWSLADSFSFHSMLMYIIVSNIRCIFAGFLSQYIFTFLTPLARKPHAFVKCRCIWLLFWMMVLKAFVTLAKLTVKISFLNLCFTFSTTSFARHTHLFVLHNCPCEFSFFYRLHTFFIRVLIHAISIKFYWIRPVCALSSAHTLSIAVPSTTNALSYIQNGWFLLCTFLCCCYYCFLFQRNCTQMYVYVLIFMTFSFYFQHQNGS